jgi:uncharacterized protein with von Willebrand factor type A (vWA) domain
MIIINKKGAFCWFLLHINIYQSTWRHVLEDSTLHQPRCEIINPYNAKGILSFLFTAYLTTVSVAYIEYGREKVTLDNNKLAGT